MAAHLRRAPRTWRASILRAPALRAALVAPVLLVVAIACAFGVVAPSPTAAAEPVDACEVLTADEVSQVTGLTASEGVVTEVWPGAIGCSFGTAPYDVRTHLLSSTSGRAIDGLGAGDPVDGVGDGARWVWCEVCLESDTSSSSNMLVVAQDATFLTIAFEPTTDEAAHQAVFVQEQQLAWAVELARLAVPRLAAPAAPASSPPLATASPSAAPATSTLAASPSAEAVPSATPTRPSGADAAAPSFADSVATPDEISTDPVIVLQSLLLAALLVFLMPFPGQLFNSTLEAHEDEVRRWLRLDRLPAGVSRLAGAWATWPGVVAFTLLATLLYGLLDPDFGLDAGSAATFLGMLLGIVLVTTAFSLPAWVAHRRYGDRPVVRVVPLSLLVAVACVLVSRLADFQPGYLYGLLIGLAFARELSAAEEGRTTAVGAGLMLVTAFACWLALWALPDGSDFGLMVVRTALAALMVAGLEGCVFGLLPMRFLPGEPLYAWNRPAWGGLLGIGAFAFFHVLINPSSGYLADASRTPLLTVLGLLIGFAAVSVAFWAWFRVRSVPAVGPGAER